MVNIDDLYKKYVAKYNKDGVYLKICIVDLDSDSNYEKVEKAVKFFTGKRNMCHYIGNNNLKSEIKTNSKLIKIYSNNAETTLKTYQMKSLADIIIIKSDSTEAKKLFPDILDYSLNNLKPNGLINIQSFANIEKFKTIGKFNRIGEVDIKKRNGTGMLIMRKKILPYYEKSVNFIKYKSVIPKMRPRTLKSYHDMNVFNRIVEKHKIKYVAVAGTNLGLNRHGGIIPWDNDIDIGFIKSEWSKLFKIKKTLNKAGLKYRSNGKNHCHFGAIDCFKLELNDKGEYYRGTAKTFCHVNEYKNIAKQIFGYTYIYAPFCSDNSLEYRYGKNYFIEGDVNDNCHFEDKSIKRFKLESGDLSYQIT